MGQNTRTTNRRDGLAQHEKEPPPPGRPRRETSDLLLNPEDKQPRGTQSSPRGQQALHRATLEWQTPHARDLEAAAGGGPQESLRTGLLSKASGRSEAAPPPLSSKWSLEKVPCSQHGAFISRQWQWCQKQPRLSSFFLKSCRAFTTNIFFWSAEKLILYMAEYLNRRVETPGRSFQRSQPPFNQSRLRNELRSLDRQLVPSAKGEQQSTEVTCAQLSASYSPDPRLFALQGPPGAPQTSPTPGAPPPL